MEGELHLAEFHSCEFSGIDCVFSDRQSSPASMTPIRTSV